MADKHKTHIETTDREIITTRVFNAPRELVYQAWTDPAHLAKWWGPKGFTNTFHEFDPRPGGAWDFIMHGPDGTDYKNKSVFVELVKPERIVFNHLSGHKFKVTVLFEDLGGMTRLTWRMLFDSAAEFDRIKGIVVPGNQENIEKLEAYLAKMA
jgi:uncharacterized protein YndB with AHSA1/START domain